MPSLLNKYFTFGTIDSRSYGVYISGGGTYNAPPRSYNNIIIPGRDGDLLSENTRLQNVVLTYPAGVVKNTKTNLANFRSALLSVIGYAKLTDSYHSDEFRLAVFKGPLDVDMLKDLTAGEFEIEFECKPQRFLTSGETVTTITANSNITNPTLFPSKPLLRVYGYGVLKLGSQTVTITDYNKTYIDIDCEMMDCFNGANNLNSYVTFSGNDFPVLPSGTTGIEITGITKVEITPRWWRV